MAFKDTWRRSLEYFGLVEGDYIEEGEYEEGDTGTELAGERGLERLSMGTSQDWRVAVEEGATIIRLGSVLWA